MASSPSAPTIPPPPTTSSTTTTTTTTPSAPQTQQATAAQPAVDKYNNANPLIHTIALGVTPLALLALCLPPRRLDLRATLLGGVAIWGTNQLAHDYSGKSFAERFSARMASFAGEELPDKAKATQSRLREEKELRMKLRALRDETARSGSGSGSGSGDGTAGVVVQALSAEERKLLLELWRRRRQEDEEQQKQQQGAQAQEGNGNEKGEKGVLERIWMGDAEPDWKEKRAQREREALREGGGGYWGLIVDQITEVWSGGNKNEGVASKEKTAEDDNARKS